MATWSTPLPNSGEAVIEEGDSGHPEMHAQTVACVQELRTVVDAVEASVPSASEQLTGTATAQADSVATDVTGLVDDFNALLAKLRSRGVLAP